jgi:hypothetical protein
MTYNLVKTAAGSFIANEEAEVSPLVKVKHSRWLLAPHSGSKTNFVYSVGFGCDFDWWYY